MAVRRAALVAALLVAAGCGGDEQSLPRGNDPVSLDASEFTTTVDNRYWPMKPGTRWSYRETGDDGERLRVVVTVTSETRRIANGITARVVRDTVSEAPGGAVVEDTFDWYAQDGDGNVWYLGEQTAEFEDGTVASISGSFEAGVDGALPGIVMPAEPDPGQRYRQEYYEGEAEDNGEVLSTAEQVEVPAGHFRNAVLTKDTAAIEPNVLEYELYAPGVGPVLTLGVSGGGSREELIRVAQVAPTAARAAGTVPLGRRYP